MAETMKGLKRTHRCTEVTTANVGQTVTVMGWVQKSRNKGGIILNRVMIHRDSLEQKNLPRLRALEVNM